MPRPRADGIVAVMSTTTRTTLGAQSDARGIRIRLSARARKLTLLVHIAAAGAWLGLDLVLGILIVTGLTSGDPTAAAASALSLAAFATWPLVAVGAVTLASGVLLGLGTKYGLVRYWWVLVKLVVNIVLVTLVVVLLWPGIASAAEAGRTAIADDTALAVRWNMVFPPIVSSTAVIVAMTLAVFKPWGRVRRTAG
jgi:hypothetical protein